MAFDDCRMMQGLSYITSSECNTYSKLKARVKRKGSFRCFMFDMFEALSVEQASRGDGSKDGDEGDSCDGGDVGECHQISTGAPKYKAREVQASSQLRLNVSLKHELQSGESNQRRCALCCEKCSKGKACNSRMGYKARKKCTACNVYLCSKSRNGQQKSCHDLWHSRRRLPDMCNNRDEAPAPDDGRKSRTPPPKQSGVTRKRASRTPPTVPESASTARRSKRRQSDGVL